MALVSVHCRFILGLAGQLVVVVPTVARRVGLGQHALASHRLFHVVIVLRSIKATVALLPSRLRCSGDLVLHCYRLIVPHVFNVLCDDVILAKH